MGQINLKFILGKHVKIKTVSHTIDKVKISNKKTTIKIVLIKKLEILISRSLKITNFNKSSKNLLYFNTKLLINTH